MRSRLLIPRLLNNSDLHKPRDVCSTGPTRKPCISRIVKLAAKPKPTARTAPRDETKQPRCYRSFIPKKEED